MLHFGRAENPQSGYRTSSHSSYSSSVSSLIPTINVLSPSSANDSSWLIVVSNNFWPSLAAAYDLYHRVETLTKRIDTNASAYMSFLARGLLVDDNQMACESTTHSFVSCIPARISRGTAILMSHSDAMQLIFLLEHGQQKKKAAAAPCSMKRV